MFSLTKINIGTKISQVQDGRCKERFHYLYISSLYIVYTVAVINVKQNTAKSYVCCMGVLILFP